MKRRVDQGVFRWVLRGLRPVKRIRGYLYFIDNDGDICRTKMIQLRRAGPIVKVRLLRLKKERGYIHYVGIDGKVYRERARLDRLGRRINTQPA